MDTEDKPDLAPVERDVWERPAMIRLDAADAEAGFGFSQDGGFRRDMMSS